MSLTVAWTPEAWEDYLHWQATDKAVLRRINKLIKDIQPTPFEGIGKPEQLRFDLAGRWSRRIDSGHRLVYSVAQDMVIILACRYHY